MGSEPFEAVDVVVVGAGNAAACAALAARDQGASVLMVEAAPQSQSGGNTRYTAGAMRVVFNGVDDLVQLMPDLTDEERTTVREVADAERLAGLSEREAAWIGLLLEQLPGTTDLEQVTTLVYGVPKLAHGLSLDAAPTDEVKADQKEFFTLLYNLLVDADRGPRLPTLILALGADKVRSLLSV